MNQRKDQICSNCIMDTSDEKIIFDDRGWCDYCCNYHKNIQPNWHPNEKGIAAITPLIEQIKREGAGQDHDCLIGISGGLDSSYVAYVAKEKFGLRPLMFHCDTGWNSDVGVSNIKSIIEGLGLDLVTEVINWEEMKDMQIAFLKSQLPSVETAQDLALFSAIYKYAVKNKFKYVITGGNHSTECVREPVEWSYFGTDTRQVNDVHRQFGSRPLETYPMCDILTYRLWYRWVHGLKIVKMLDSVPYIKKEAIKELSERFGWRPYKQKHYESRFSRFFESYWAPKKFNFDKRRVYFSSEILTGQMTRDEALARISTPELSETEMREDFEYVAKKLDLTVAELEEIFKGKNKTFRDYKNIYPLIALGAWVSQLIGLENRHFR